MSPATPVSQPLIDQLAPTGRIRVAINYGNPVLAQKDEVTGEPGGISPAIGRELSRRLGLALEFVAFDAAGKVFAALTQGRWDVAFLAIDPARAVEIDFTAPYVIIEGSYLVRADSPFQAIDDVDRAGVRVLVGAGSAYDLYLTRTLRKAQIVRAPTGQDALDAFLRGETEVLAGVKSPLQRFAANRPELRLMPGRFMAIEQAMGVPKGRIAARDCLQAMLEELKASGFVAAELARSGQHDALVAPAASPPPR